MKGRDRKQVQDDQVCQETVHDPEDLALLRIKFQPNGPVEIDIQQVDGQRIDRDDDKAVFQRIGTGFTFAYEIFTDERAGT